MTGRLEMNKYLCPEIVYGESGARAKHDKTINYKII